GQNRVQGNTIGTDVTGIVALGNRLDGVLVSGNAGNTIGGTAPGARNLLSGNLGSGVSFTDGAHNNLIQGNYIGTDVTGKVDLGNAEYGVHVEGGHSNTIGGSIPGAGNLISGNDLDGVHLLSVSGLFGSGATQVQGNFIGTNAAGTSALGNALNGV